MMKQQQQHEQHRRRRSMMNSRRRSSLKMMKHLSFMTLVISTLWIERIHCLTPSISTAQRSMKITTNQYHLRILHPRQQQHKIINSQSSHYYFLTNDT